MKKIILVLLVVSLSGCFGPAKFDSSNDASIKESTQKIIEGLPEGKREKFRQAMTYFTLGGQKGFSNLLGAAFSGMAPEKSAAAMVGTNLSSISGLTGEQILDKYDLELEQDRIEREEKEAERKKQKAEREAANKLENEAQALLDSNKFEQALAKYKELSEMSSGVEAAAAGIEETTEAMREFTEKMAYMDKVEITEFQAKRIDTYAEKGIPAVRLSLRNNGDRSLDRVKIVVYFKDKKENVIFEEDYLPVLVNKYVRGNKPLKPGYVQEMGKGKYYTIDSVLSDWQEGNAFAKVVDIGFSK